MFTQPNNFHYVKFTECTYGQERIFCEFNKIVSRAKRLLDIHENPLELNYLLVNFIGQIAWQCDLTIKCKAEYKKMIRL